MHAAIDSDCQTIAAAPVKFSEILTYPSNKLHGSVVLSGVRGEEGASLGSLDYWIKLHTHDTRRLTRWLERRRARDALPRYAARSFCLLPRAAL